MVAVPAHPHPHLEVDLGGHYPGECTVLWQAGEGEGLCWELLCRSDLGYHRQHREIKFALASLFQRCRAWMFGPVVWEAVAFSTAKYWEAKRNRKAPKSRCLLQEHAPIARLSFTRPHWSIMSLCRGQVFDIWVGVGIQIKAIILELKII